METHTTRDVVRLEGGRMLGDGRAVNSSHVGDVEVWVDGEEEDTSLKKRRLGTGSGRQGQLYMNWMPKREEKKEAKPMAPTARMACPKKEHKPKNT